MRVAERQHELGALELGAIADAADLEAFREPGGDAGDHVVDQRARQTVQRPMARLVAGTHDPQLPVIALELHLGVELARELAERPLDRQLAALLAHLHALRERDRHATDS